MRIRLCFSERRWPLTPDLSFRSSLVARLTQILFRSADFRVCPGLSTRLQASRVPADRPGVPARSAPAPPLPEPVAVRGGLPFPGTAAFAPGTFFRISGGFFAKVSGFSSDTYILLKYIISVASKNKTALFFCHCLGVVSQKD